MIFGLLYFCVVILCANRSRSSFILYRIVKRHSRQSNVRRIWTCADNERRVDAILIFHDVNYPISLHTLTLDGITSFKLLKNVENARKSARYSPNMLNGKL